VFKIKEKVKHEVVIQSMRRAIAKRPSRCVTAPRETGMVWGVLMFWQILFSTGSLNSG